ncbi:MAG: DUF255 domain-containing protein [Phycisphaerales bacterium]|nr:DUF255 domain-containing protein [Phycisphaerales bacterium]
MIRHAPHVIAVVATMLASSWLLAQEMPPMSPTSIESRNRLGNETSPYLLQHQHNPVHWWPWGPEAFAAARALDRPIFLSVGYSTCYWCHVMERESFEDEATAAILNEHFIPIKVDREERPDVDDIYMKSLLALNRGQGGWPMSVFLEPGQLKPFLAGTYFPPDDGQGRPSFTTVLNQVIGFWRDQRPAVLQQADQVAAFVGRELTQPAATAPLDARTVERGITHLQSAYDDTHGGWGRGNKFPMPGNLDFLMAAAFDRPEIRQRVLHTLDRMATGGLYDQIGGGFHRYTVDVKWLVPHFEKMLYDNGQLLRTYALAYEQTRDPYYAEVIRETAAYIARQMTAPSGAFFSAQDAEVNHREGENYLWTSDEVTTALEDAGLGDLVEFTLEIYGFKAGPNFRDPHHPGEPPRNVVHLLERPDRLAATMDLTVEAFDDRVRRVNAALLAVRSQRDQPLTDDKILAGWNGLMIAGLAESGRVLDEPAFVDAAARAASTILRTMREDDGGLLRTARGETAKIDAFSEDYAGLVHGLLALHRATGDGAHLSAAADLMRTARARFWDDAHGGYFDTLPDQTDLFVRIKSTYDGAVASGNNLMIANLVELHDATGDTAYLDDAVRSLEAISTELAERPTGAMVALRALDRVLTEHPERLAAPAAPAARAPDESNPVIVTARPATLALAPGGDGQVEVTLTIARGFHINAHRPGLDFLIPLAVEVVGTGIEVEAVYPAGERYRGPEGDMIVHNDSVTIPVTVTRRGALAGPVELAVTYQVCTDTACLAPATVTVPVRLTADDS